MTVTAPEELDIGEVAERTGLTASALRYYERRGLIASSGRNGLRRTFDPDVIEQLTFITCARAAGFTLAEVERVVAATPDDHRLRASMARRADSLQDEIARLTRMQKALRHASTCDHTPLVRCPTFKGLLAAT